MNAYFEFNFEEMDNNELRINGKSSYSDRWDSIIIKKEWIFWIITTLRNLTYEDYNTWEKTVGINYEDCELAIIMCLFEREHSYIDIFPIWKDEERITPPIEIPYLSWNKRLLMSEFIEPFLVALSQFLTEKGGVGIYSDKNASRKQTYCNHAVFLTVIAADSNYTAFTNRNGTQFPEADSEKDNVKNKEIEKTHEPDYFYYYKASNYWCDILAAASKNESTGIKEVNLEQAQKLANQGYVVIACKKKPAFQTGSPHFATIRPNAAVIHYTIEDVSVANVGDVNEVMTVYNAFKETDTVKYYYNSRQMFQKDMSKWNEIRCGLYKAEET